MKKGLEKLIAAGLAASVALLCGAGTPAVRQKNVSAAYAPSAAYSASADTQTADGTGAQTDATKEETVYVTTSADGTVKETIVSDWLKNNAASDTILDSSDLTDIQNVSGDETFTQDADGNLTWQAAGADIYYQGSTTKELPVGVQIAYTLDGQTVTPEELAGKSGKLTMEIHYQNNLTKTVSGDDGDYTIYAPFTMVTLLYLENSVAQNVTVSSGKVINDGDKNIVVAYAMPGLAESLGVDDENLPDSVTVTADVTDFELLTTLTVADDALLNDVNVEDMSSIQDLEDALSDLAMDTARIFDATAAAPDAGKAGLDALQADTDSLNDSMDQLTDKVGEMKDGAEELNTGADSLASGADELNTGVGTLQSSLAALKTGTDTLASGLNSAYSGAGELSDGLSTLSGKSGALNSGASSIADAVFDAATTQLRAALVSSGMTSQEASAITLTQSNYLDVLSQLSGGTPSQGQIDTAVSTIRGSLSAMGVTDSGTQDLAMTLAENALEGGQAGTATDALTYAGGLLTDAQTVQTAAATYGATLTEALTAVQTDPTTATAEQLAMAQLVQTLMADPYNLDQTSAGTVVCTALALDSADPAGQVQTAAQKVSNAAIVQNTSADSGKITALGTAAASAAIIANAGQFSDLKDQLDQVETFVAGVNSYTAGVNSAASGASSLHSGLSDAVDGAAQLQSGANQLVSGATTLKSGTSELNAGAGDLAKGMKTLYDGTVTLYDGTVTLQKGLTSLMDSADDLADIGQRLKAVQDFGREYCTFGGCLAGMDSTVRFVMETDSIEAK